MWHSVAHGGSGIEADEEGHSWERDPRCQELWLKERQRLSREDSTLCLWTLKLTDTLEVVQVVRRLHRLKSDKAT